MKIPYGWLGEFIAELPPVSDLVEILDGLGLAVEEVHGYAGAAAGTVAVRIDRLEPVQGSEHLRAATVTDGSRSHRVLTGAPNAREGMITAFAAPGVHLPALDGAVERREMAGDVSEGVLLSPRELGVFDWAGGLVEFGEDVTPGADLAALWPGDQVIELELTPNRADAFSILGVARDLAAKLGVTYTHPAEGLDPGNSDEDDGLTLEIADRQGSPHFTLRRIDGVGVAPSPAWLQRRLATVGVRPRNNIVDVTNLVTFELGQPSHAYDLQALHGGVIEVRRAHGGEPLTTLGGDELELDEADLVIATPEGEGSKAIGLAGVIGGLHDSVEPGTTSVALEVAHFDPVTVRSTAKRHRLVTDAHYRFERGVDPALPPLASARAAALIAQVAGGRVHGGVSIAGGFAGRAPVSYRPSRVGFIMDFEVAPDEQRGYLEALGCSVEVRDDAWSVTPPSWRFDIAFEEDLVEEVGRLHGYHHIGETVPAMRFVPPPTDPTHRRLRGELAGLGFQEAISYVFTSEAELDRACAPAPRVRLANPQGVERSVLRTALFPALLAAAAVNRKRDSLALFEVGRVFLDDESERVALVAGGRWLEGGWREGVDLDFYLFKGLLETLAARLNATVALKPARHPHLHPGISASVEWNGRDVGCLGKLHPQVAGRFEVEDLFVAELALPLAGKGVRYRTVGRQPHAERDIAVVAESAVTYAQLRGLVEEGAGELLESVEAFDVYSGEPIPEGSRSVALRLRFRHAERALRDEEVDRHMEDVISLLRTRGYDIRDR